MKTPRPHQARGLDAIRASARRGNNRILVVAPCGSGKMFLSACLIEAAVKKGNSGIFFADKRELVKHQQAELTDLGVQFGVLMADDDKRSAVLRAHVISKDTLWSRAIKRGTIQMPHGDVVCFDEAHRSMAKTWQAVAEHYKDSFIVGFTATPCRTDGRGLGDFYQDLIVMATYKGLQAADHLVPVRIFAPHKPDLKGLKCRAGDYEKGKLEKRMDQQTLVGNIVEDWKKRGENRGTVAFAAGVNHSIHIRNEFRRAGISAEHIDGKTEKAERDDILERTQIGLIQVLCNCDVMTEGVDVPRLKCAILARPTKSMGRWRQMCGRIMRPYPGYTDALILDHSASWEIHGFPDEDIEWSLDTTERIQDRVQKQREKQDANKDPFACPECKAVYRGPQCPYCGHRPKRKEKKVAMVAGKLHEAQRRAARQDGEGEKQKYWDRKCLGVCIGTKKKVGAAYHMYKGRYGCGPGNQLERVPRGKYQWNMTAEDFYDKHVIGE